MKLKAYIWSLALFCLSGCVYVENNDDFPIKSERGLSVFIEKVPDTRSVIGYDGSFQWSDNDYIGVYSSRTDNACFYLQSQNDEQAQFVGHLDHSEDVPYLAYYPYYEKTCIENQSLIYEIPELNVITNENNTPMIGVVEDNVVYFKYLGGCLNLRIEGIDDSVSQLIVSAEGENSQFLSGTATVDNINEEFCTYYIESGSKNIVYDMTSIPSGLSSCVCYIPMPVGEYRKIGVKITDKNNETIVEKSLSDLTVSRAHMISVPTIHLDDNIGMYHLPDELLNETDWDGAFLLSNNLFVAYQDDSRMGSYYIFSDLFHLDKSSPENNNIITVTFDEEDRISFVTTGNTFYECLYDDEGSCQVNVRSGSQSDMYDLLKSSSVKLRTKANIESKYLNVLNTMREFLGNPFVKEDKRTETTQDLLRENAQITEKAISNWYNMGRNPLSGVESAVDLIYAHHKQERWFHYMLGCGNAYVMMNTPRLVSDNYYEIGYTVHNYNDILSNNELAGNVESGYIIREVPIESINGSSSQNMYIGANNVKKYGFNNAESKSNGKTVQPSMCYFIRAYIGSTLYKVYSYSDNIVKIMGDAPTLQNVSISNGEFNNGQFYFKVNAVGGGYLLDQTNYYMFLQESLNNYSEKKYWTKNSNSVTFDLYLNREDMDYASRQAKGFWRVYCSNNEYDEPQDSQWQPIFLSYNQDPSLEMSVKLISGPTPITKTKADEEDDLQYIQYQVTVNMKGGGWIVSTLTSSSNGTLSRSENPRVDRDTFIYTGSAVFKEKSELPTIRCEGTLINGSKIYADGEVNLASLF